MWSSKQSLGMLCEWQDKCLRKKSWWNWKSLWPPYFPQFHLAFSAHCFQLISSLTPKAIFPRRTEGIFQRAPIFFPPSANLGPVKVKVTKMTRCEQCLDFWFQCLRTPCEDIDFTHIVRCECRSANRGSMIRKSVVMMIMVTMMVMYILWWSVCLCVCHEKSSLLPWSLL